MKRILFVLLLLVMFPPVFAQQNGDDEKTNEFMAQMVGFCNRMHVRPGECIKSVHEMMTAPKTPPTPKPTPKPKKDREKDIAKALWDAADDEGKDIMCAMVPPPRGPLDPGCRLFPRK